VTIVGGESTVSVAALLVALPTEVAHHYSELLIVSCAVATGSGVARQGRPVDVPPPFFLPLIAQGRGAGGRHRERRRLTRRDCLIRWRVTIVGGWLLLRRRASG